MFDRKLDLSQTFNQHNPQHARTSVECWFTQATLQTPNGCRGDDAKTSGTRLVLP